MHDCQQNFNYIVAVSIIDGGNRSIRKNHRPASSHWQILSQNVVPSTPGLKSLTITPISAKRTNTKHKQNKTTTYDIGNTESSLGLTRTFYGG